MKKGFMAFTLILLLALLSSPAFAASTKDRVFDYAQLLTAEERANLQDLVEEHIERYNMDIVLLTINDNKGKATRVYADDFYDKYGFGYGVDYAGILFLIDMDGREIYISTTGRMIDIFNDTRIEGLLDNQYDLVTQEQYYDAFLKAIEKTAVFIDSGPVSGQYRYHESRYLDPWWVALSIVIGVGTAAIVVSNINNAYKKKYETTPYNYRSTSQFNLSLKADDLIDKQVSERYDPPPPPPPPSSSGNSYTSSSRSSSSNSRSHAGRSTTHRSSSGRTHGGGGRKF